MNQIRLSGKLLLLGLVVFVGCQITQAQQPVDALLETQSTKTRVVLEQAVGNLLNSQPVKLADDVFTLSSTVIIERSHPKDGFDRLIDERDLRPIDSFTLLLQSNECLLKHDQTKVVIQLLDIECIASKSENEVVD